MGTQLVSIQTTDAGETLFRRYDAAHPDGPTHQGTFRREYQVTRLGVERFLLDPPEIARVAYETEPQVA